MIMFLFLDEKAEGWDVAQVVAMLCEYFGIRCLKCEIYWFFSLSPFHTFFDKVPKSFLKTVIF